MNEASNAPFNVAAMVHIPAASSCGSLFNAHDRL